MTQNNTATAHSMPESGSNRLGKCVFLDQEGLDQLFGAGIEASRANVRNPTSLIWLKVTWLSW